MRRRHSIHPISTQLAMLILGLAGCSASQPLPSLEPGPSPPPAAARQEPNQFQLVHERSPERAPLNATPEAPYRVAILVRQREDGGEESEDVVSEGIVAEALKDEDASLPPGRARLEIVNRQVYEKALERDATGLRIRKLDVDARILRNLAEVGVDILAVGEIGSSGVDRAALAGEVKPQAFYVDATISLVRVDNATTLGVGTASAQRQTARESRKEAIRAAAGQALRRFLEVRDGVATVTLTVEGLGTAEEEAQLEKSIRSTKGVLWVKPSSFELGPADRPSGVARMIIGWNGDPEDLKKVLGKLNPGFRLAGTLFEGNRWTFRAEGLAPASPARSSSQGDRQ